jgi:hypothetical protein
LSWWHRLLGAPGGYIFFSEDGMQTLPDMLAQRRE